MTGQHLCLICDAPLHKYIKYYCSGFCLMKAKESGLYDNEKSVVQKSREPDPVYEKPLHPAFIRATKELRRKGIIK
jgi:hypothetical protein